MKRIKDKSADPLASPEPAPDLLFTPSTEQNSRKRAKITITFGQHAQPSPDFSKETSKPLSSKIKELRAKNEQTNLDFLRAVDFRFCAFKFDFVNHRCLQFNENGLRLNQGISYSVLRPILLFNNFSHFSLLRIDSENQLEYLEKVQAKGRKMSASVGFFKNNFPDFVVASFFGKQSEIWDIEKRKSFNIFPAQSATFSAGIDSEVFFYKDSEIKVFDIRAPSKKCQIGCLKIRSGQETDVYCWEINKKGPSLLASTESGCFYFDLRKTFDFCLPLFSLPEKIQASDKSEFNIEELSFEKNKRLANKKRVISFTKNWLLSETRALLADFLDNSVQLHDFSTGKIEGKLNLGDNLLDVDFFAPEKKIAVLFGPKESKLAFYDLNFVEEETLELEQLRPDKLGFFGPSGLLAVHGKGRFGIFDTRERTLS